LKYHHVITCTGGEELKAALRLCGCSPSSKSSSIMGIVTVWLCCIQDIQHPPSIITTIDRSIGPSSLLIAAFGESPFTGKHSSHDLVTAGPFSFSFSSIDDARLRARFHSIQPVGVCRGAKDSDSGDIVRKSINQPSP